MYKSLYILIQGFVILTKRPMWDKNELKKLIIGGSWKSQFFESVILIFYPSSLWKSINNNRLARMGQKFDDYPGFQPKTTFQYYNAHHCNIYFSFSDSILVVFRISKEWVLLDSFSIWFQSSRKQEWRTNNVEYDQRDDEYWAYD